VESISLYSQLKSIDLSQYTTLSQRFQHRPTVRIPGGTVHIEVIFYRHTSRHRRTISPERSGIMESSAGDAISETIAQTMFGFDLSATTNNSTFSTSSSSAYENIAANPAAYVPQTTPPGTPTICTAQTSRPSKLSWYEKDAWIFVRAFTPSQVLPQHL
jgi:hypothetical protein